MTTLADSVASWVKALRYEDLTPEVIEKSKRVLLDTIGCALGAIDNVPARIARQVIYEQGGNPQATLIGGGGKVSCEQAAFLNGMALRYLDYNDYVLGARPLHPSINIAPALAIAEMRSLGGKDLLLAIIVGYEVELRLRDAAAKESRDGWDYCATTAQYSSAATAGKLLGLDEPQLSQALAIAGSHANTLGEVRNGALSMWKGAAEPMAARNGTFAALLARAGMTGPATVFEGKFGYEKMVVGALEQELLRHRSGDFQILKSCVKIFPCVVTAQAPIAAALQIRRQKVLPDEIESISVALSDFGYQQQLRLSKEEITTREVADHSVVYVVARALLDGEVRWEHFEEQYFRDPRALALAGKVVLQHDSQLTALYPESLGAHVQVRLRNGNVVKVEVPYPVGHEKNPTDDAMLIKKFLTLSESILGRQRANRAIEVILSIENASNLSTFVEGICRKTEIEFPGV
jgi:2-methylcitrate dehydratase